MRLRVVAEDTGPDERDEYERFGYEDCWDVLKAGMKHPPSFEVFFHVKQKLEVGDMFLAENWKELTAPPG